MEEFMGTLKQSGIFSGITEDGIRAMLKCLEVKREDFRKGDYILTAGQEPRFVGLLLSGRALIIQEDYWGNRNIVSGVEPGQIFAESFACSDGERLNVSVAADENCAVMWMDVARILRTCPTACAHHSRMIRNLLANIARKNVRLGDKLTHMGRRSIRQKLLSYLSEQARLSGSGRFEVPFTRQEMADYLAVDRSAMSAQLCRLRDEGVLSFSRNRFSLLRNPETVE